MEVVQWMSSEIQLDLFEKYDEVAEMKKEIWKNKLLAQNVQRGVFKRIDDHKKMVSSLKDELDDALLSVSSLKNEIDKLKDELKQLKSQSSL